MALLRKKKIDQNTVVKYGVLAGLSQVFYTGTMVFVMNNMGKYFQVREVEFNLLASVLFLLIFLFSVIISGLIMLGGPGYLILQKKYHEAALTLLVSLVALFLVAVLIFLIIINF